jgi:uncharacterized protein
MLLIETVRIPEEGLDIDEGLEPAVVRLEDDPDLVLRPGARLKAHVDLVDGTTIHVRGRLTGAVEPDCGRCLEHYNLPIEQELDLFYLPRTAERPEDQEEEVELSDRDVVVGYYDGGRLDLAEVMREQILLAVPLKSLCREDCRGLCPSCGTNLNLGSCGCAPPVADEDPRLAPLRRLIPKR